MKAKYDLLAILRHSLLVVGAVCSIGVSTSLFSQAVLNPNQISGKVSFTNQNPEILNILSPGGFDQGFNYLYLRADSVGVTPALNNYAYPQATGATQSNYQLTVESSAAGIPYNVSGEVRLGNRQDRYILNTLQSARVYPEPAADVNVNFYQCVGMLDINFVDTAGNAVALNGGSATAHHEMVLYNRPYYKLQAQSFSFPNGTTREFLAVNGNAGKYKLDVIMESGSDPSSNLVRGLCRKFVAPGCDQVVPVTCVVGGSQDLGQIFGTVDVLGEEERDISYLTRMRAFNGPLQNYRYDHVAGSGDYLMDNLVPSDAETPAKDYWMYGEIAFGVGFRTQFIRTPWLGLSTTNPGVPVEAGKITDLGNTFVLDPGYISGLVLLAAPPAAEGESFLHDLNRNLDVDYNNDGVSDYINLYSSHVQARGLNIVAEGSTMSTSGGLAEASFEGAYDTEISSFVGDYRMALGGLKGESSVWQPNIMALQFTDSNPAVIEEYRYSYLTVRDNNISNQVIAPGSSKRIDHSYCMNDIALSYKSLSGTFFNPHAFARGSFIGTDFLGNTVDQTMYVQYAYGIPRQLSMAANRGLVNMALPQGTYEVTPKVTAVNPDGSYTYTELPPVSFDVACRQDVTITTDLQLSTDELPLSTDESDTTVSGSINSLGNVVIIKYVHNQSPEVIICENCGKNPTYTFNVSLTEGENKILVSAEDEYGDVSTSTSFVTYEPIVVPEPDPVDPLTIVGCSNKSVMIGAYETSAEVDFTVTTEGGCGTPTLSCDAASGDLFSLGTTNLSCKAVDSCGTEEQCQFSIKVEAEEVEEPVCGDEEDELYTVSSVVDINQLWPPNHKFKNVGLVITENDPCAESSDEGYRPNTVTTVWSDEPELAQDGSGNFAPDAKDMDANLSLRAERSGQGNGRVYLLVSKGTSASGDDAFSCSVVTVPHARGAKSIAAVTEEAKEAKAYCEANNGSAPPSFYQHGFENRTAGKASQERSARMAGAEKSADAKKAKEAKKAEIAMARDAAKAEAEKAAAIAKAKENAAKAKREADAKKAAKAKIELSATLAKAKKEADAKSTAMAQKAAKAKAEKTAALAKTKREADAKKAAMAQRAAKAKAEAKKAAALAKAKREADTKKAAMAQRAVKAKAETEKAAALAKAKREADAKKVILAHKAAEKAATERAAAIRAMQAIQAFKSSQAAAQRAAAAKARVNVENVMKAAEATAVKPSAHREKTAKEPDFSSSYKAEGVADKNTDYADIEVEAVAEQSLVDTDIKTETVAEEDSPFIDDEAGLMAEEESDAMDGEAEATFEEEPEVIDDESNVVDDEDSEVTDTAETIEKKGTSNKPAKVAEIVEAPSVNGADNT